MKMNAATARKIAQINIRGLIFLNTKYPHKLRRHKQ